MQGIVRVGTLYLESDLNDLHQRTRRIEVLTAQLSFGMLAVVYLLTSLLVRTITRPIELLAVLRARLQSQRIFITRPLIGGKELQHLALDFNQMLQEIQKREHALVEQTTHWSCAWRSAQENSNRRSLKSEKRTVTA